jgi:hypothetical protein
MAPRVDRTVARCLPARWSSPERSRKGSGRRPIATWKDTPITSRTSASDLLSLFKGQGAAARDDLRVVEPAALPTAGV